MRLLGFATGASKGEAVMGRFQDRAIRRVQEILSAAAAVGGVPC